MDASVPLESESLECRLEFAGEPRDAALTVEVVNPQQPFAAAVTGAQVAAGRGQKGAEVKWT